MHILVINDDGPPSNAHSPYVHSLIATLQEKGYTVSVVLPDVQRSWIGKAHFVNQIVKPTYFRPGTLHEDDGTTHSNPLPDGAQGEEWVLVDGTPATCAQLGLYHFYQDRGPVDLVISGPNYGRNSTALYSLSSGTIGGAMEAAICGKKAIALSYAFQSLKHDPRIIAGTAKHAINVIEQLYSNWGKDVDLYSVNVPVIEGVEKNKVLVTYCLPNRWSESSFKEVEADEANDLDQVQTQDKEDREHERPQEVGEESTTKATDHSRHQHRYFKWGPSHTHIRQGLVGTPSGNDGLVLTQGCTSVTPLKARFAEAESHELGELKPSSFSEARRADIDIHIDYEDSYVQPLLLEALSALPSSSYNLSPTPLPEDPLPASRACLHVMQYEKLSHTALLFHPNVYFGNSYTQRTALIRKNQLAATISSYLSKHPTSVLRAHSPPTVSFELDYAEFLDEALLEAYELHESWAQNEGKSPAEREWWILKPALADRGQGIRLFSTEEGLQAIFEEWEADNVEESENEEDESGDGDDEVTNSKPTLFPIDPANQNTGLITSLLRHFVAQPYIPPLLLPDLGNRKFHVRTYVLAVGALRVYVYRDMLALFAAEEYVPPGQENGKGQFQDRETEAERTEEGAGTSGGSIDMRRHLTNTCLQFESQSRPPNTVHRYWSLPPNLSASSPSTPNKSWLSAAFSTICECTADVFVAAAAQPTAFQPLPNAFEVFGLDFLVDVHGEPWLLEVNAFPDFAQTGEDLKEVVAGLWKGVLGRVGKEMMRIVKKDARPHGLGAGRAAAGEKPEVDEWGFVEVLDLDMRRR